MNTDTSVGETTSDPVLEPEAEPEEAPTRTCFQRNSYKIRCLAPPDTFYVCRHAASPEVPGVPDAHKLTWWVNDCKTC